MELQQMPDLEGVTLSYHDVDSRPEWQQQYGAKVPLLLTTEGDELCRYFLDPLIVNQYLSTVMDDQSDSDTQ